MLEANRYRRKSIVKKPILYLHLYKSIDICSFIQIRIHIVYIKADQCEIHGVPIISRGLFLETKIDDPKNWRVSSSPSYFGSWLAEIAPRGWQCGFNVVLPWPSSLSPFFPFPPTTVPHSRQEGNSGTGCLSSSLAFSSTPLCYHHFLSFVVSACLSHPRILSIAQLYMYARTSPCIQ